MKIRNLNKSFDGNVIFNDFNLSVEDNKITYIMGKSGVGKTTLLRIISGLDKKYKGEIVYEGKLAYVFQEPRLFPNLTALENVTIVNESPTQSAKEILDSVGLSGYENMMPDELSGGMKMRLSIARALYSDADIVLMDEPFAALDDGTKEMVSENTFKLLKNKTVIVVSHSKDDAEKYADKIINI